MKLKILFQNQEIVVVHKPAGFVTYADSPDQKEFCTKLHLEKLLRRNVFPVHRLDKDTCGLLAYALSSETARNFTELFRSKVVKKKYLALVHGKLKPTLGVIDFPLEKNKSKELESARTKYKVIQELTTELGGESREYSLVICEPETGKYHQIRRHLRKKGNPIIGDPEHGNRWENETFDAKYGAQRTLLSAVALAFPDRKAEKMVRLISTPDADFQIVLDAFGWKNLRYSDY